MTYRVPYQLCEELIQPMIELLIKFQKSTAKNIIVKNENDVKVNLLGNKLNPSVGFADNKIKIGYMHDQLEEIDVYGNKDD